MRMDKSHGSDDSHPDLMFVPFEVVGDTETLAFLTMTIWLEGNELTHTKAKGDTATWHYSEHLHQWESVNTFDWSFALSGVRYDLAWAWIEISTTPDTNPIEEFPKFAEGPWYFFVENGDHYAEYFTWPEPGITGMPRAIPEPATLSLLFLGLAAIGVRRRLR